MTPTDFTADVIVAGGGPVGLAAAIEAAEAGMATVVVEPRPTPIDKACGEGLMPGAVDALGRLGIQPTGWPFRGIRYLAGDHVAEHRFRAGAGLGVRRLVLHAALSTRAEQVGVRQLHRRVTAVEQDGSWVYAGGGRARWLLACDGLHSPVRHQLGLDRPVPGPRRYGLRQHYRVEPWSDCVEVYWGDRHEAYVTPVAEGLIGVALLGPAGQPYDDALAGIPGLGARLRDAVVASAVRGAGPLRQGATRRVHGRVLLVGDAAGYVDALTGEGIAVGLAQARTAVRSIIAGQPQAYERTWHETTRRYRLLTVALLAAATRPGLRRRVVPAAARLPGIFATAVEALAR